MGGVSRHAGGLFLLLGLEFKCRLSILLVDQGQQLGSLAQVSGGRATAKEVRSWCLPESLQCAAASCNTKDGRAGRIAEEIVQSLLVEGEIGADVVENGDAASLGLAPLGTSIGARVAKFSKGARLGWGTGC